MTVKELYLYLRSLGLEDATVEIQNGDDGGAYDGTRIVNKDSIAVEEKGR